jgi:hypothetical protein
LFCLGIDTDNLAGMAVVIKNSAALFVSDWELGRTYSDDNAGMDEGRNFDPAVRMFHCVLLQSLECFDMLLSLRHVLRREHVERGVLFRCRNRFDSINSRSSFKASGDIRPEPCRLQFIQRIDTGGEKSRDGIGMSCRSDFNMFPREKPSPNNAAAAG